MNDQVAGVVGLEDQHGLPLIEAIKTCCSECVTIPTGAVTNLKIAHKLLVKRCDAVYQGVHTFFPSASFAPASAQVTNCVGYGVGKR